jgi:hypothetical protein
VAAHRLERGAVATLPKICNTIREIDPRGVLWPAGMRGAGAR